MSGLIRSAAARILSAASRLLPPGLSPWAAAMARELPEIGDDREALLFAAGCLRAAAGLAIADRLRSARASARTLLFPAPPPAWSRMMMNSLSARPRLLGLLCAAGAVGIGLAYMLVAGAPSNYLLVNLAALVLGATAWLALGRAGGSSPAGTGAAIAALAIPLLLTAWFGATAGGASRWVNVGPLSLQVSMIVLPVMIVLYARRQDPIGTAGMVAAALALALQPDRAMAGVLLAALLLLLVAAAPRRLPGVAAAAAAAAFAWTLIVPDTLSATPFVDRILYTAFDLSPIAGAAVVLGAAALVLPAVAGLLKGAGDRAVLLAFGGCWAAVVAAAALSNYPTPLVGYGGSAVLGYLLSVSMLPGAARSAAVRGSEAPTAAGQGPDRLASELRVASPA